MRSAPAIGFEYRSSPSLTVAAAVLAVLAACAIPMSGAPPPLKVVLLVLASGYGAYALLRPLRPRVRALTWRGDGSVSIVLSDRGADTEVQGRLQGARVLGPLVALKLRWPHGAANLWLLPDNLDADTRRRLRVRLGLDGVRTSVNADSV